MKKQKKYFACITAVGALLEIVSIFSSGIGAFRTGVLSGMATGLLAVGLISLIRLHRLEKNPEKAAEYEATLNDERTAFIANKARAWTFLITVLVELAAGMIALYVFDQRVLSEAFCILVCFQCLLFTVLVRILNRKY